MKLGLRKFVFILELSVGAVFALLGLLMINGGGAASGALLLVGGVLIFFGFKQRKKYIASKKSDDVERAIKEKQEEFDSKFGKFDFKIAGVTFENDDGSSRQTVIENASKAMAVGDDLNITFERDEYKGKPRVGVLFNGKCAGNVEAWKVNQFIEIVDKIKTAYPEIGSVESEGGESVLYCHLYLTYSKE